MERMNIFERILNGESVSFTDANYSEIVIACNETRKTLVRLNTASDPGDIRKLLKEITAAELDASTALFPPLQISYGKNTKIGKNVFINFDCTFLDLGGITIEDNVLIAPKVSLLSEGHPISARDRQTLTTGRIRIKKNAW